MTEQTTQEVPPRVAEFLRENQTLTLATASPNGAPRATTLRYASDDLNLYVWMRSSAWAAQQIEQNPLVSFAINEDTAGLQGSGQARSLLSGENTTRDSMAGFWKRSTASAGATSIRQSSLPVPASHSRIVPSQAAEAMDEFRHRCS